MDKQLLNTQKRLNIMTNAVSDMLLILSANQPDYVREQMAEIVAGWEKLEDEHPMEADNG